MVYPSTPAGALVSRIVLPLTPSHGTESSREPHSLPSSRTSADFARIVALWNASIALSGICAGSAIAIVVTPRIVTRMRLVTRPAADVYFIARSGWQAGAHVAVRALTTLGRRRWITDWTTEFIE